MSAIVLQLIETSATVHWPANKPPGRLAIAVGWLLLRTSVAILVPLLAVVEQ